MASLSLARLRQILLPPAAPGRLSAIDGLRAVAALLVLFHHFHTAVAAERPVLWGTFVDTIAHHGWTGVHIFFVLSGFVISHSVGSQPMSAGFFGRFALRRSLRLDPPYWAAIAISYALLYAVGSSRLDGVNAWVVLANMLYLDNIIGVRSLVAVGWTLCLELQFYLVFVVLVWLAQTLARRTSDLAARAVVFWPVAVLSVAISAGLVTAPLRGLFIDYWSLFFLGVLARWSLSGKVPSAWLFGLVALELGALAFKWDAGLLVGSATALGIFVMGRREVLGTALSGPVMQYLGRISYSLYLIHPLVGNRVLRRLVSNMAEPPGPLLAVGLVLAATVASVLASTVFYLLVEHPSLTLSQRIRLRPESHAPRPAH